MRKTLLLVSIRVGLGLALSGCGLDLRIAKTCQETGEVWTRPAIGTITSPNPDINNGAVNICAHPAGYVTDQQVIRKLFVGE